MRTERLLLRRFQPEDGLALHRILGDAETVRYEPYEAMSAEACLREAAQRAGSEVFWAVCQGAPGKEALIGNITMQRREHACWELGYILRRDKWGAGYATEAARALVGRAFEVWQAHRVIARCNPENASSVRVMERLGMRREALHRKDIWFRRDAGGAPLWQDTLVYALLAEEFRAL